MNLIETRLRRMCVISAVLCACEATPDSNVDTSEDVVDTLEDIDLPPPPPHGTVRVEVAPLGMKVLDKATFAVIMTDAAGEIVAEYRGLESTDLGQGDGAFDTDLDCPPQPEGSLLDVHLVLENLEVTRPLVDDVDYYNPCKAHGDCTRKVPCLDGATESTRFDLLVTRRKIGGVFDLGVEFGGLTCSLSVSCKESLLFVDGERVRSHVVGFTCVGAADTPLNLYLDDLELACDSGTVTLDSASPEGNQSAVGPVNMWANYRGEESSGFDVKHYWNIAFALGPTEKCTVRTKGTSSTTWLAEGRTPDWFRYPYISIEALVQGNVCEDGMSTIAPPLAFAYSPFGEGGVCFENQAVQDSDRSDPVVADTLCTP